MWMTSKKLGQKIKKIPECLTYGARRIDNPTLPAGPKEPAFGQLPSLVAHLVVHYLPQNPSYLSPSPIFAHTSSTPSTLPPAPTNLLGLLPWCLLRPPRLRPRPPLSLRRRPPPDCGSTAASLPPRRRSRAVPLLPLRSPLTSWRGAAAGRGTVAVDPVPHVPRPPPSVARIWWWCGGAASSRIQWWWRRWCWRHPSLCLSLSLGCGVQRRTGGGGDVWWWWFWWRRALVVVVLVARVRW
jgi:hypothetical protein